MKRTILIFLTLTVFLIACGLPQDELDQYREKIDELKEQIYDNEQQHAEQLHELNQKLNRASAELERFHENPNHLLDWAREELEQLQRDFYLHFNVDSRFRYRISLPGEITIEYLRLNLFEQPEIIPFRSENIYNIPEEYFTPDLTFHSFSFIMSGGIRLGIEDYAFAHQGLVMASASNRFHFATILFEFVIDNDLNIEWTPRAYRVGHDISHDNPWIVP